MITYNKTKLSKEEWYIDENQNVIKFKEYRNNQLATFNTCYYDEKYGYWIITEIERYLTASEVKRLKTI